MSSVGFHSQRTWSLCDVAATGRGMVLWLLFYAKFVGEKCNKYSRTHYWWVRDKFYNNLISYICTSTDRKPVSWFAWLIMFHPWIGFHDNIHQLHTALCAITKERFIGQKDAWNDDIYVIEYSSNTGIRTLSPEAPFTNITAWINNYNYYKWGGMKLLIHSQTSTMEPLTFANG